MATMTAEPWASMRYSGAPAIAHARMSGQAQSRKRAGPAKNSAMASALPGARERRCSGGGKLEHALRLPEGAHGRGSRPVTAAPEGLLAAGGREAGSPERIPIHRAAIVEAVRRMCTDVGSGT